MAPLGSIPQHPATVFSYFAQVLARVSPAQFNPVLVDRAGNALDAGALHDHAGLTAVLRAEAEIFFDLPLRAQGRVPRLRLP